ncbi:hypothetical protein ACRALDRAFT_208860 [Sodiomyces alcalophilus JCM 7366]|uniref:uncharacterized protein n=1 Tax=Sodiomyces alcalophilus JCM 7366 TaxID=591952 RepID=UPI0039B6938A
MVLKRLVGIPTQKTRKCTVKSRQTCSLPSACPHKSTIAGFVSLFHLLSHRLFLSSLGPVETKNKYQSLDMFLLQVFGVIPFLQPWSIDASHPGLGMVVGEFDAELSRCLGERPDSVQQPSSHLDSLPLSFILGIHAYAATAYIHDQHPSRALPCSVRTSKGRKHQQA